MRFASPQGASCRGCGSLPWAIRSILSSRQLYGICYQCYCSDAGPRVACLSVLHVYLRLAAQSNAADALTRSALCSAKWVAAPADRAEQERARSLGVVGGLLSAVNPLHTLHGLTVHAVGCRRGATPHSAVLILAARVPNKDVAVGTAGCQERGIHGVVRDRLQQRQIRQINGIIGDFARAISLLGDRVAPSCGHLLTATAQCL